MVVMEFDQCVIGTLLVKVSRATPFPFESQPLARDHVVLLRAQARTRTHAGAVKTMGGRRLAVCGEGFAMEGEG